MKDLICHILWKNRWSVRLLLSLFVCFNLSQMIESQCTNIGHSKSQFLAKRDLRSIRDFYIYMVIYKHFSNFIRTSTLSTVNYNTTLANILTWKCWGNKLLAFQNQNWMIQSYLLILKLKIMIQFVLIRIDMVVALLVS